MTGFGSAEAQVLGGRLRVDIRTVNHRYFNPQLKLPAELAGIEGELRERLRQRLERGHVAVTARWVEPPPAVQDEAVSVDLARARDKSLTPMTHLFRSRRPRFYRRLVAAAH